MNQNPMPHSYSLSKLAEADIIHAYRYIAEEELSPTEARLVYERIVDTLEMLSQFPEIGQYRPDITAHSVKVFPVPRTRYLVFYEPQSQPVFIARVLSSSMNLTSLLKGVDQFPVSG